MHQARMSERMGAKVKGMLLSPDKTILRERSEERDGLSRLAVRTGSTLNQV